MANTDAEITLIAQNTWAVQDDTVRFFLLAGEKKALLIDTGKTKTNVREIVESLTTLPVTVVNTHTDGDHTHCNRQFETVYMHPAEMNVYHNYMGGTQAVLPVWDGDIFDLGGRTVKVIHTPGHTSGSITFLDVENRILIAGDGFQDGTVYLFGAFRDLQAWGCSLDRLISMRDSFDYIFPSHASIKIPVSHLDTLKAGYTRLINKEIAGEPTVSLGCDVRIFDIGGCKLLLEKKPYSWE